MTKRPVLAALGLTLTLGAFAPSVGIAGPDQPIDTAKLKADWKHRIDEIESLLRNQTFRKAKKESIHLQAEMIDAVESGQGAATILAIVTFQRAIAEAGLGEERDALWDLNVAFNFDPKLKEIDRAAAYGTKVADFLDRGREKQESILRRPSAKPDEVSRPEVISKKDPHNPLALRQAKVPNNVSVEAVIDIEGRATFPAILVGSGSASLDLSALEALRLWRFRPARKNGSPVAVYYVLTVSIQPGYRG